MPRGNFSGHFCHSSEGSNLFDAGRGQSGGTLVTYVSCESGPGLQSCKLADRNKIYGHFIPEMISLSNA